MSARPIGLFSKHGGNKPWFMGRVIQPSDWALRGLRQKGGQQHNPPCLPLQTPPPCGPRRTSGYLEALEEVVSQHSIAQPGHSVEGRTCQLLHGLAVRVTKPGQVLQVVPKRAALSSELRANCAKPPGLITGGGTSFPAHLFLEGTEWTDLRMGCTAKRASGPGMTTHLKGGQQLTSMMVRPT